MKVIYIYTVLYSSENIYILLWYCAVNDDKPSSTSSQIIEQIEVIK